MVSVVRCGCQLGRGECMRIPAQGGGGGVSSLEGGVRMPRVPARAWRSVTANGPELAPERRGGWGSVRCRSAGNVASTSVRVGSVSQRECRFGQPRFNVGQRECRFGHPQYNIGQCECSAGQRECRFGQRERRVGQPRYNVGQRECSADQRECGDGGAAAIKERLHERGVGRGCRRRRGGGLARV